MHVATTDVPRRPLFASDDAVPCRSSVQVASRYDECAVAEALERDFALHGAPLVLRADRWKAHDAPKVAGVKLGRAGEAAVFGGEALAPKTAIKWLGRTRIPDRLTGQVLSEVKNVAYLSYTRQLRDFSGYALSNGLRFELWVRPTTQLSGLLAQAVEYGEIWLRFIP